MKRRTFFKLGALTPFVAGNLFAKDSASENFEKAKREARKQISDGIIAGAVFGTTDGIAACGVQTKKPLRNMGNKSRFDIASVGKTFTASCCALLCCDGKLDPDAPFTKYLPEHKLGRNCKITVRHLATHSSGFDNSKPYCTQDKKKFFSALYNQMPVRNPREKYEYSCYNFILLGFIVERVSGMNLGDFSKKRIWQPLGMTNTQWNEPGDGEFEVEHYFPHRPAGRHNDTVCYYFGDPLGSGSCFSTCTDMLKFVDDIANRRKFTKEYYDLISTCQYQDGENCRSFGWDMTKSDIPKGLLGEHSIFHTGWTGQTIFANPETGKSAVVLTSRTGDWGKAVTGRKTIAEILTA